MALFKKQKEQLPEDSIWMIQLAEGQTQAFDRLYQKYSGQIFGFFKSRVKDMDLVNDLNQMTWENVYKKAHQFDPAQKFSSWLYSIASHVMIDEIRKKTRLDRFKNDFKEDALTSAAVDDFVFVENSENDVFNSSAAKTLTDDHLNILSEQHRLILESRFLKEKSFEEIAVEFKLTSANVRKIISRSLKKLKGSLK